MILARCFEEVKRRSKTQIFKLKKRDVPLTSIKNRFVLSSKGLALDGYRFTVVDIEMSKQIHIYANVMIVHLK